MNLVKIATLFVLIMIPGLGNSQIEDKIEYHNTRSGKWAAGSATWAALFFRDYDLEQDIKVRGQDDSLLADNIIKVEHSDPDVSFYDVTGMKIEDSSTVTFYGTFYVRNYDLSPEEKTKKVIGRKGADGVTRVARIQTDSSGRAYFKEWTIGWISLSAERINKVKINNSNIWVNSDQEKSQLIRRYYRRVNTIRYTTGLVSLVAISLLLAAG